MRPEKANINIVNGKASLVYSGKDPWHTLGTRLNGNFTSSEAIAAANLGYIVSTVNVFDGDMRLIKNYKAVLRDDTRDIFGIVSSKWAPIQNTKLAEFADALVGSGNSFFHTAGCLGFGEDIWFLLEVPKELKVGNFSSEQYKNYLFLSNNHIGKRSARINFTSVRVICQNTFNAAIRKSEGDGVTIRHIGDMDRKIEEAKMILGLASKRIDDLGSLFTTLVNKSMTSLEINNFVEQLFPIKEDAERTSKVVEARAFVADGIDGGGTGLDEVGIRGTRYAALQSAIEFYDFQKGFRSAENRMKDICFGGGIGFKTRALELLVKD